MSIVEYVEIHSTACRALDKFHEKLYNKWSIITITIFERKRYPAMSTQISAHITEVYEKIKDNIGKVIVGKSDTIDMLIVSSSAAATCCWRTCPVRVRRC